MRASRHRCLIAVALVFCLGCGDGGSGKSHSPLQGRLDAAAAIEDRASREQALAKVAVDAASAGEVDVVKRALEKVEDRASRESKKQQCALLLAKGGKTAEAT